MHGGLGLDHTYFRPSLDSLARSEGHPQIIYYDHRGGGRSRREPLDGVTHATWAGDADALRAHLGHERVVLLGHSYGDYLALDYVLAHPERVAALILVSTAPVLDYLPVVVG